MTSKKLNFETSSPLHYNNLESCNKPYSSFKSYEHFLRKKYSISDDLEVLIKKGHILKNNSIKQSLE